MHRSNFLWTWAVAFVIGAAALPAGAQAPAAAQQVGRVLALAGSATAERGGQVVPLAAGAGVQGGDVLNVGEASVLQLRFNDESLLSLREKSRLRIDEFRYTGNPADDRSFMQLLRGGLRTVTGLIGKANPGAYGVRSYAATIGIRGTHFTLVACEADCTNADGSRVPNGMFGGVTDGRISVTNQAGESEFGQEDYFFVAGPSALPERLLAPPGILSDRAFTARARAAAQARAGADVQTQAARAGSTESSNSVQSLVQKLPASVASVVRNLAAAANERPAVVEALTSATGAITAVRLQSEGGVMSMDARSIALAQLRTEVPEVADRTFYNAAPFAAQLARVLPVEARPAAGAYWVYLPPAAGGTDRLGVHWIWGDTPRPAALPTSGVVTYSFAGGTQPTDNFGRVGAFSAGKLSVDFAAARVQALDPIGMLFTAQGPLPGVGYVIPAGSHWSLAGGLVSNLQCSGCLSPNATVTGRLVGAALQGYVGGIGIESRIGPNANVRHIGTATAAFGR